MAGFGKTTRGTSQLLFRAGLESNMLEAYTEYPPIWNKIMRPGTTSQVEIQRTRLTGSPNRMFRSYEGEPPVLSRISFADKFSAVDRTYQGGYGVTLEAREDDLYGKLDKGGFYLGHAARLTEEYLVAAFLDDAFTGTAGYLGMDGLALMSAVHPLGASTTLQSNLLASPVAISVGGFMQAFQLFMDMKDENGDPIQSSPDTLIIPNRAGYEADATRILNQVNQFGTANRDDNGVKAVLGGKKITIIKNPYMTSTSNWFLVDSKLNDAHFLTRKGLTSRNWMDDATQDQFFATRMRILSYFYNWRGWVGSNPT